MSRRAGLVVLAALTPAGCRGVQSALDPSGPAASGIAGQWWLMFGVTITATAIVFGLLVAALRAGRRGDGRVPFGEMRFVLIGGGVIPAAILVFLTLVNVRVGSGVARPPEEPRLTVEVVGHQFWWEIRYPQHGIVTANELVMPAGVPVRVELTASDVIHSFWVPRLHGKMDMNPGRRNVTWLLAREPGVHRGQCAEFCGIQHALMSLLVIVEPPEAFQAWVRRRQATAPAAADERSARGRAVFAEAGCDGCHRVARVYEPRITGAVGPDLTDLASRRTLAAVTVPNTPANVAAFIVDPNGIKPGVRMPATSLAAADLDALVAYLGTLR